MDARTTNRLLDYLDRQSRRQHHFTCADAASSIDVPGRTLAPTLRAMVARDVLHEHFDALLDATYYGVGPAMTACTRVAR